MPHNLPRREFLRLSALASAAALLAACERVAGKTPTHPAAPTPSTPPSPTRAETPTPAATATPTNTPTTSPTPIPACFALLSPPDYAELPMLGKIGFAWETWPAAASYRLEITAPTGKAVAFDTTSPSHDRFAESLPWGGGFTWQVTALDAAGVPLCTAGPWRFSKPQPPTNGSGQGEGGEDDGEGAAGDCCFLAGTLVTMADGSLKPIELVAVGDLVLSRDMSIGADVPARVGALESPLREGYCIIGLEDGTELGVTDEHPLYCRKAGLAGWGAVDPGAALAAAGLPVVRLEPGDSLARAGWVEVRSIRLVRQPVRTWNLRDVGSTCTFFAGGVLVHNKGGDIGMGPN